MRATTSNPRAFFGITLRLFLSAHAYFAAWLSPKWFQKKSGESAVVAWIGANEDPFDDVDEARELTALVDELGLHDSTWFPQEYVTGDNNLLVCDDAGENWDEHFLAGLFRDQADTDSEELEDREDDSHDLEPPSPKIK